MHLSTTSRSKPTLIQSVGADHHPWKIRVTLERKNCTFHGVRNAFWDEFQHWSLFMLKNPTGTSCATEAEALPLAQWDGMIMMIINEI